LSKAFVVFVLLLMLTPLGEIAFTSHSPVSRVAGAPSSVPSVNYLVVIMMENHPLNISSCCGGPNGIIGNLAAPYITQLSRNYSLSENYFAISDGSLPNYLAMTGGSTFSNVSCLQNDSPPTSCWTNSTNIIDRVEASGRTWKAYMEDYTGGCSGTNIGAYDYFHNPFPYFLDIQNSSQRCNRIVSANPGHVGLPDNQLISDLNSSSSAPNFMWLTPNEYNNMHGYNGQVGSISTGDTYLAQLIPQILKTYIFTSQNAALLVTWDEPTTCSTGTVLSCPVPAIWIGPAVKRDFVSNKPYSHYSILATIESVWNLVPLTSNDATALSMTEFFSTIQQGMSLTNLGDLGVVQGGYAYNTITLWTGGSGQSNATINLWCSSPAIQLRSCTLSPSSLTCNNECNSTIRVGTFPSTPSGSYNITVAATQSGLTTSTTFKLGVLNPTQLVGDVNGDCNVDIIDLTLVAGKVGKQISPGVNPRTDLNLDGIVNIQDVILVAVSFGKTCS
jgi:phosphatidylinositol-3-phosphatase